MSQNTAKNHNKNHFPFMFYTNLTLHADLRVTKVFAEYMSAFG